MRWATHWQVAAVIYVAVLVAASTTRAQPGAQPLCVMNIDGSGFRKLDPSPSYPYCGSPDWSPNGEFIAYDATGERGFNDQHVLVVELATGEITDLGQGGVPSIAPDNQRVAFHRFGTKPGIWVANRDGSGAKLLFKWGSHPRWSRDGKMIAFRAMREDNLGIYDVDSGEQRMLFDEPTTALSWGRDWSPDGKRLVVRRAGRDGSDELVLISAAGASSGLRVRYRGDMSSHVNWSQDGRRLLVGVYLPGDGPRHLHYLPAEGREKPTLIPGQDPEYDYCDGTFSPDGEQVAFGWKWRGPQSKPQQPKPQQP